MKNIRIGLGRFYNGNLIKLVNGEKLALKLNLGKHEIEIYISDKTRHVLPVITVTPPQPKIPEKDAKPTMRENMVSPSPEKYPADLYIELIATKQIEIDNDLYVRFNTRSQEARDEVLRIAHTHKNELEKVLDYAAGFLGLRINIEMVSAPILDDDQLYAYREGTSYALDFEAMTTVVREEIFIDASANGGKYFLERIRKITPKSQPEDIAEAIGWMLRGWASQDKVLRFVSFFTALESIIPKESNPAAKEFIEKRDSILRQMEETGSDFGQESIKDFILGIRPPAPLNSSFETWASGTKLPDWEKDVKAFRIFNKTRNLLLHTGELGNVEQPDVQSPDVITLESIASKYLSWRIFGNCKPYSISECI